MKKSASRQRVLPLWRDLAVGDWIWERLPEERRKEVVPLLAELAVRAARPQVQDAKEQG